MMAVHTTEEETLIGLGMEIFIEHRTLALLAAGAGVAIALAYLAADYVVVPALRLRAARRLGPNAVKNLLDHELGRLTRLRNAAAVQEEQGHPGAAALRDEAELRNLVVRAMERAARGP
ncbi:hypothetical protein GBA63_22315 (plasmid) [Rubrobacter tropicus]|uniref:Uncharacterized protein n=1 Tax=Rubrobacter tropicus TaxID=2653851 RepID=A0A6G8QG57_9ACTN|nr:hypothetical protein [Rubrobacter tropicus]QIN85438.1 hypothetical protein GBA63_22315 [Rubrobacter tropicus]